MARRPRLRNDAFAVGEDGLADLPVLANDRLPRDDEAEGALRIVKVAGEHLHGAVTVAVDGRGLLWDDVAGAFDVLAAGETQVLRFTYTARTGEGERLAAKVRLTVAGANDAPDAGPDQVVTVAEGIADTATIATVAGRDPDQGAVLRYGLTGGNEDGLFEIDAATGAISLAPGRALDAETARRHVLTATIGDGGLSDAAQVTVNVGGLPGSLPGALDLVTASGSTDAVSVRLGDGAGGFAGATEVRVGAGPESVALGDLDRDGRLDLVTANLPAASGRSGMSLFLGAQKKGRDAGAGAPRSKACHGDTAPPSAGTSRPRDGGLRQVLAAAMTGLNTMSRAVSCNSAVDANGAVTHVVDTLSTGLEVRR